MAPSQEVYAANALKAVTYRLSSVPAKQLPGLVTHVTAILPACKPVLAAPQIASGQDGSETAVLVHKFRTQISTLLQDRSVEGRWSAVVLAKSAVELGGWEMLHKSGPWVRGLLGILTKPDPPTTKVLTIVTLTRIFMLTRDYQTLVREITTPSLTPFITSCVNMLHKARSEGQGSPQLVETILESFSHLLPRHPTTFRPHLGKINQYLSAVVAQSAADEHTHLSADGLAAARRLYAQLPNCAAKTGSKEEWEKSLQNVIVAAHQAADKVFRAVIEDWESVTGIQPPSTTNRALEQVVQQTQPDQCGFPAWTGIYAGSSRLIGLLELLTTLTASSTSPSGPVSYRIAHVVDLLTRVLSITAPAGQNRKNQGRGVTFNDQVGKEERNALFTVLPQIHVAAMVLLEVIVDRFGRALSPVVEFFLERLSFVFQEERSLENVRAASYTVLSKILPTIGSTLAAPQVKALNTVMHACCEDLLPRDSDAAAAAPAGPVAGTNGTKKQPQSSINADSFLSSTKNKSSQSAVATTAHGLRDSAYRLLPLLLAHLPARAMDNSIRARIDSTAVLAQHESALLASVLSLDPRGNPSLLPLLARLCPESPAVEALLRPRVPAIRAHIGGNFDLAAEDEEDDEEDEDDENEEKAADGATTQPSAQADEMQLDGEEPGTASVPERPEPVTVRTRQEPQADEPEAQTRAVESVTSLEEPQSAGKRPSTETEPQPRSPKRARVENAPPRDVPQPGQQEPPASTLPAAVPPTETVYGAIKEDEDDDDGDVEVPTLVMGDDEDDEDDEDDDDEGSGEDE